MLKQSHTPPSAYCMRTASKLICVATGLKYNWYHHDNVSTLVFPNLAGVLQFHNSKIESLLKAVEHIFSLYMREKLLELGELTLIAGK